MGLAGATELRGILGFGKSSHMHAAKILRLSMDLPMVIEIVDTREKVETFLPCLEPMMGGGLVTLERSPGRSAPTGPGFRSTEGNIEYRSQNAEFRSRKPGSPEVRMPLLTLTLALTLILVLPRSRLLTDF
jgi:hypothetical protein